MEYLLRSYDTIDRDTIEYFYQCEEISNTIFAQLYPDHSSSNTLSFEEKWKMINKKTLKHWYMYTFPHREMGSFFVPCNYQRLVSTNNIQFINTLLQKKWIEQMNIPIYTTTSLWENTLAIPIYGYILTQEGSNINHTVIANEASHIATSEAFPAIHRDTNVVQLFGNYYLPHIDEFLSNTASIANVTSYIPAEFIQQYPLLKNDIFSGIARHIVQLTVQDLNNSNGYSYNHDFAFSHIFQRFASNKLKTQVNQLSKRTNLLVKKITESRPDASSNESIKAIDTETLSITEEFIQWLNADQMKQIQQLYITESNRLLLMLNKEESRLFAQEN